MNKQYIFQLIRFIIVWMLIIFIIYSIYNYLKPIENKDIKTPNKIIKIEKIYSQKELQIIKSKFNITNTNFSNRITHTSDGISIKRIP